MKINVLFSWLLILCLKPLLQGQSFVQWVPGTTCQNCPSSQRLGSANVANGNNSLVTTYTESACGLNFVQVSKPLFKRNFSALGSTVSATQPASFVITGIPISANVIKAFLYADASGGTAMVVTPTIANLTNSVSSSFTMTNIGTCADKCWSYGGTQSYRCDVTSAITGNGTYVLSGFPVMPQSPSYDIDGATIFVIYSDPSQNFTGNIVIADGCQGISGTVNSTISGFSVCGTPSTTTGFGLISDLQRISNTNFRFNSTTNNYVKTQASDQVWDFVMGPAATATTGQTSANFGVSTGNDCYNFLMAGMYYQNTCLTCCGSNTNSILSVSANSAQICAGTSATLIASPAGSYTWNPGNIVGSSIVVTPTTSTYYSATILNSSGCGGTVVPVIVDPLPSLTLSPSPQTVCPGLTSNITCSGAFTYTLHPGGSSGNPIPVNPTVATIYTVVGTSSIGCNSSKTVAVQVFSLAPVVPTHVSPLCAGGSLSLSVGPAFNYTWNGPANYTYYFQHPVITNATSANSGVYTVTVLGPNNCYNSATLNVVVNPQAYVTPTVTPFPPICNTTAPFNLTVTPSGGGWSGNLAVSPAGLLTPTFAQTGTSTAVYTVFVGPCLNSTTIHIDASTFNPAALTSSVPNLCVTDAPFDLMNIVQSAVNGTWTGTGVIGTYTFFPPPSLTNTYVITYSTTSSPNASACPASSTLSVSVTNTLTPLITPAPPFCNNEPVFSMTVNPSGGTWYGNGAINSSGVITPSLAILSNSVVTYSIGIGPCVNSATSIIYPNKFYSAALTNSVIELCANSGSVSLMSYAQSTVNGSWSGQNVALNAFIPSGLLTNTYHLVYHTNSSPNPSLCPHDQTLSAVVLNPTIPNIYLAGPFCTKDAPVQMSVSVSGGNWTSTSYLTPLGVLIPSLCAVGNNAIQYVVGTSTCFAQHTRNISVEAFVPATIMNKIPDICNTGAPMNLMPITLSNSGIWTGPGISGTSFNPALTGAGSFVLNYATSSLPSGLCPDHSTVAVKVHSLATPVITQAGPFCDKGNIKQLGVSPVGGYFLGINTHAISSSGLFNPALGVIGDNILSYSITQGPCVAIAQTTISIERFVSADFEKLPPIFCRTDEPMNFNSLVKNPGGVWGGNGMTGSMFFPSKAHTGNNNVITYQTFSSPTATLCPDKKEIRVRIDSIPDIKVESLNLKGCAPFEAILNTSQGGLAGNGEWNFGDGSPQQTGLYINHIYETPGTYSVVFNYSLGSCHTQTRLESPITVYEMPMADFMVGADEISIANPSVRLENTSHVLGNNRYEWTIQGVGTSTEVNPEISFPHAGSYRINLVAISIYGCKAETGKIIDVKNDFSIYFPNSFTPNGDGINEEFMPVASPYGLDNTGFEMEIFDRWGHSLFLTRDINKGWNGTLQNKGTEPLKDGVYVYKVKYKDKNGQLYDKVGSFTLMNR